MKITKMTNIDGFFRAVDQCKGKVELVTDDGDRINLKSKIAQFISFAKVFASATIPPVRLVCSDKDDMEFLIMKMASDWK